MTLFSSPLDRAADRCVRARFKVSEAERRGLELGEPLNELQQAEAQWRALCEAVREHTPSHAPRTWFRRGV